MMKTLCYLTLGSSLLLSQALVTPVHAADTTADPFNLTAALEPGASHEFVEVRLGRNLIRMAAQLVESSDTQVAEILRGLEQVQVNVIGLNDDNRDPVVQRLDALRAHLDREQWERVVTVRQDNENVCVHLKSQGEDNVEGLVVSVVENGREAILVRITGNIRPTQICEVAEALDLKPLKKLRDKLESH